MFLLLISGVLAEEPGTVESACLSVSQEVLPICRGTLGSSGRLAPKPRELLEQLPEGTFFCGGQLAIEKRDGTVCTATWDGFSLLCGSIEAGTVYAPDGTCWITRKLVIDVQTARIEECAANHRPSGTPLIHRYDLIIPI